MNKRIWTTLAILTAVLVFAAGQAEARTWKLSHVRPQDTAIDKDLNEFAKNLKETSGGKMEIKLYPSSSLGDYTVVQERIGLGAIDMACQPPATAADKRFQLISFPYLVTNYDDAKKQFGKGGVMFDASAELYAKQGIRMLAAWPVYFGGIALNTEPKSPGDPNVAKGIKLRVPAMKTFQLLADNTGYIGTPMPFSEAFTAVQTGVVDGVMGSGAEGYYSSFRDVTKYYIPLNTHFEVWYLIMTEELYKGLPADQKKVLDEAAERFQQKRWETVVADQKENEQKLVAAGAKLVPITDQDIQANAKKARETVWPKVLDDVGKDWGQKILDKIAK
jgi:TRAP-type C4-dicarboxylate transport system substrate-binding protein